MPLTGGRTSGPLLAPHEQATAGALVASNDILSRVLAGAPYSIDSAGPWLLNGKKQGAVVSLTLDQPVDISADLPTIDMGIRGADGNETRINLPGSYATRAQHFDLRSVRALQVLVDLQTNTVVEILPVPAPAGP